MTDPSKKRDRVKLKPTETDEYYAWLWDTMHRAPSKRPLTVDGKLYRKFKRVKKAYEDRAGFLTSG